MPHKCIMSVDIGSTYTKAAFFKLEGRDSCVIAQESVPTTSDDVSKGFFLAEKELFHKTGLMAGKVYFSSSARGGLKIAAMGLVSGLTLAIAKLVAASAGGKIVGSFSYGLTAHDIEKLKEWEPDIVLMTGGTDGGHESLTLKNAGMLAAARLPASIIFAGNNRIQEKVAGILSDSEVYFADNVMPEVGEVNIEPAREIIRRIFINKIVDGKGLSALIKKVGNPPKPTPLSMFELVGKLPLYGTEWDNVCVVDMGGATTDVYSNTETASVNSAVVLKGIREPRLTRTVEGDLGLRVSAGSVTQSAENQVKKALSSGGLEWLRFCEYVLHVTHKTDALPRNREEREFDRILATACLTVSLMRHAGRTRPVWTSNGTVLVQRGKDMRSVKKMIGTGGFLALERDACVYDRALKKETLKDEEEVLLPERPEIYADAEYLLPLLGNLACDFPEETAMLAIQSLEPIQKAA